MEKKRFVVSVREVWTQEYAVEADSAEEALKLYNEGKANAVDNAMEFGHVLDFDPALDSVTEE